MLTPDAKRSCHSNRYKKNEARVPTVVFIASPWVEAVAGGRKVWELRDEGSVRDEIQYAVRFFRNET
jgi:hypothetical protein